MDVKRQQGRLDQLDLFEARKAGLGHGATGDGGTGSGACVEPQASAAWVQQRALTTALMEEIASSANLNQAYKRVRANKGAAGVDGMSVGVDSAGWKSPSPGVACANWASQPWWIASFNKRFCKSWSRFSILLSRTRVSAFALVAAPIWGSPRHKST